MTTENTEAEVLCEDGETRPLSVCAETHDGRWFPDDECVVLADNSVCHQDDDDICYVERRGDWHWQDDCCLVDGEWEHDGDCVICRCCDDAVLRRDAYDAPSSGYLCNSCYESEVVSCCSCGCEQWAEDSNINEDGECPDCAPSSLISNYSDKSANRLRPESKDQTLYGTELEVEGNESDEQAAEFIRKFLPDTYCTLKHDGSLGAGGVEIVTRPDSIAVHKRMWAKFFAAHPEREMSSWSNGRCGMHVHISRAGLTDLQIGKMLCFLNEPDAVPFISKIAGRAPCEWCKVHKKKVSDLHREHDRYTALNVTGSRTVEVRIFKGTLAERGFMKNLEFVQALVEFTSPASRSIADATSHRAFCDWLPRKQYPHLFDFLVSKGFIRRRKAA